MYKHLCVFTLLISTLLLSACGGLPEIEPVNKAAIANAGADQQALGRSTVTLDASYSSTPNAGGLTYFWRQVGGPPVAPFLLTPWDNAKLIFKVPAINITEPLVFSVTVTDATGQSAIDSVTVNRTSNCSQREGWLFEHCLDDVWSSYAGFQAVGEPSVNSFFTETDATKHVIWQELATQEVNHPNVVDVKFSEQPTANGLFYILPYNQTRDMQDYIGGAIKFDIRILGHNAPSLPPVIFKVECIYPCQSGEQVLPLVESNQWQTMQISIDTLVASGLDLSQVSAGFIIQPNWSEQAGVHIQLDNIRWEKAPPPPMPSNAGVVYIDSLAPDWAGFGSFQIYTQNYSGAFVQWQISDTPEPLHPKVVDLAFGDWGNTNAGFYIRPTGSPAPVDLSAYAGGTIEFDMQILDYGTNPQGFVATVECIYPCTSQGTVLPTAPLNLWKSIKLDINTLVAQGLNLSQVDSALIVAPAWSGAQRARIRLDNIRWLPAAQSSQPVLELFNDVAHPNWSTFAGMDFFEQPAAALTTVPMNPDSHVTWKENTSADPQHGKTLDVVFSSQAKSNGSFHISANNRVNDMSAFLGGTVEFDIRVLNPGGANTKIAALVDCQVPCSSARNILPLAAGTQWQTVKLKVADLVSQGLDLKKVDRALVIEPTWDAQQGVHIQLDNIRWVAP